MVLVQNKKKKNIFFAISVSANLQYARKLELFVHKVVRVLSVKSLRNNTVTAIVLIKRKFGTQLYSVL